MVKIWSLTAEIFLICTNVARTNVNWANVFVTLVAPPPSVVGLKEFLFILEIVFQ